MPLIDLLADPANFVFNSKTRQFGNDRPGGGSSGLPYIQFPVDNIGTLPSNFTQYYGANRTGLDFPIRGGSISFNLGEKSITPAATIDKERITKFIKDKPRGDVFLAKQEGLQLSNPKIQTGDSIYTLRTAKLPNLLENTRIYNGGNNTLAQVGVQGTGAHITRNGVLPFNPLIKYYQDVVGAELSMDNAEVEENNRLLILANLKMKQKNSGNQVATVGEVSNIETINKLGISLNRDFLFQYLGGPGSVYGIGSTTIRRSKDADTTKAIEYQLPNGLAMTQYAMTYDQIMTQKRSVIGRGSQRFDGYKDFREELPRDKDGSISAGKSDIWADNTKIDVRFFDGRVDKINKLSQFKYKSNDNPWQNESTKKDSQDLIKFLFECVSNDKPDESIALFFRANISSISDTNTAAYNPFKYMGRGENFYTYQGFDRSISFSFKIAIGSWSELDTTYSKLNHLMSQVYPDYSPNTNYMRASLIKLTIGDYLYRVPGFLDSVNVTIDQASTWEIDDRYQLPHFVDVSISFKPILAQLPQRNTSIDSNVKIIRQDESVGMKSAETANVSNPPKSSNNQTSTSNEDQPFPEDDFINTRFSKFSSDLKQTVDNTAKKQAEIKKKAQTTQTKKKTSAKPATKSSSTPPATVAKPVGPVPNAAPTPVGLPPGLFGPAKLNPTVFGR